MFGGSEIGGMITALFSNGGSGSSSKVSAEGGGFDLGATLKGMFGGRDASVSSDGILRVKGEAITITAEQDEPGFWESVGNFFKGVGNAVANVTGFGEGGVWERVGNWRNGFKTDKTLVTEKIGRTTNYAEAFEVYAEALEKGEVDADDAKEIFGDKYEKIFEAIGGNGVYSRAAIESAINFLDDNQIAYYKAKEKWEGGEFDGEKYNNVSYTTKDGKNFKVYRKYGKNGVYHEVGSEEVSNETYTEETKDLGNTTYCNCAASKFSTEFGAPSLIRPKTTDYGANVIFDRLAEGKYDTDTHEFKKVSWEVAEQYASSGGLAIASWQNPRPSRSGHIATLTGGYSGNKSANSLNIFQAGGSYGAMTFEKGFGETKWKKTEFYVWKSK